MTDAADPALLATLERYYDAAPRPTARTEAIGPFTLFVAERGWPFYARPGLGCADQITVDDVLQVLDRQRELDVPQQLEWVHDVTPSLEPAARAAGLHVQRCPLLVLGELRPPRPPEGTSVRMLDADDPELPQVRAAIAVGFDHEGTERGDVSAAERDRFAEANDTSLSQVGADLMSRGLLAIAGAFDDTGATAGRQPFPSRRCHRGHRRRRAPRRPATRHRGGGHRCACRRRPLPRGRDGVLLGAVRRRCEDLHRCRVPARRYGVHRRAQRHLSRRPAVALDRARQMGVP